MTCIGSNEFLMSLFRMEENVEYLLSFIFDPYLNPPGPIWAENFPEKANDKHIRDFRAYKIQSNPALGSAPKDLNYAHFRSYKTLNFLMNQSNFKSISTLCPDFISIACKNIL